MMNTAIALQTQLNEKLLAIGGDEGVELYEENWPTASLEYFLERATLLHPLSVFWNPRGQRGSCHLDAAEMWATDPKRFTVWTGFGLFRGSNLWGEHSWLVSKRDGDVVDPWPYAQRQYFGVPIRSAEEGRTLQLGWCTKKLENEGFFMLFPVMPCTHRHVPKHLRRLP